MSSALPSPGPLRTRPAEPSRTRGCCALCADPNRFVVRSASSRSIRPSSRSQSSSLRQSSLPACGRSDGRSADFMVGVFARSGGRGNERASSRGNGGNRLRQRAQHLQPFSRGQSAVLLNVVGASSKDVGRRPRGVLQCEHDGVALARRAQRQHPGIAECRSDAPRAALEAGVTSEQVDRHRTSSRKQPVAVGVEGIAVEYRTRRIVVVEVDAQDIGAAGIRRVGGIRTGIGLDHLQALAGLDMEVRPAHTDHRVIQLDCGAPHAQHAVTVACDRARAQAQLHGMAVGPVAARPQQHPDHHALHVLQIDRQRLADSHRPLHPGRSKVQVAHALGFGDRGGSQFYRRFLLLHHATDVAIECREHAVRVLLLHGIIENGLRPRFR